MARTNPTFTRTALEEYTALKPHQKRLCWLFYRSLQTHFKEGLDPRPEKVPGSINNWKASGTVKDYIAQRNFRYNANNAARIATILHTEGSNLVEPYLEGKEEPEEGEESDEEEYFEEEIKSPAKRRKTPPPTPTQSPPQTPTQPTMSGSTTKKRVSIMKPSAERNISMKELNESAAKMGLTYQDLNVGSIAIPILRGSWQKKVRKVDDDGGFTTTFKDYNLIRMLPHSGIALKQCEPIWLNPKQLKLGIVWPKWFRSAQKQVAFQTLGSEHQFDTDHDVIDSLQHDINSKSEVKKDKKPRIVDYGIFEFDLPQDTSKTATEITILSVELVKDDLDAGEELPPGGKVKVIQIITQQKMEGDEDNILDVTEREAKLGKSLEPDGMKVGDENGDGDATVDEDYVDRFINLWGHFTSDLKTREDAIAAISPYVDSKREEIYLTLLHMLLESVPVEAKQINMFMLQGDGNYNEMFLQLRIHIREEVRVRNEAAATASATATMIDLPDNGSNSNDNLSVDNALFEEDNAHTIPQDIVIDVEKQAVIIPTRVDTVVNLEEDHEHAHEMKLHVQNRKEADHEKDTSVREKAGSNKLARRVATRSNSKLNILEEN